MVQGDKGGLELPVVEDPTTADHRNAAPYKDDSFEVDKHQAHEAGILLIEEVERLWRSDGAAVVTPAPKRYKSFKSRRTLVPVKAILKALQETQEQEEVRPRKKAALTVCMVPTTQVGDNGTGNPQV